jgi:hypothetical protein
MKMLDVVMIEVEEELQEVTHYWHLLLSRQQMLGEIHRDCQF